MQLVVRAQPDKTEALKHIASLLLRVARLYQVPDFREENAVDLAEWVMDEFQCEPLALITGVLRNPPRTDKQNWRLTPDTIRTWMADALEKQAIEFEQQHAKTKALGKEELPGIDYESYKKRIEEGTALAEDPKRKKDSEYEKFRSDYLKKKIIQQKPQ